MLVVAENCPAIPTLQAEMFTIGEQPGHKVLACQGLLHSAHGLGLPMAMMLTYDLDATGALVGNNSMQFQDTRRR